jgi:hypothetical protein
MTEPINVRELPGGAAIVDWFGRMPRFHDANLLGLSLVPGGESVLTLHAWDTTDQIDDGGFFVLSRHAVVKIRMTDVTAASLSDFHMFPAIIFDLELTRSGDLFNLTWTSSYGVEGSIWAGALAFELAPGKP